MNKEKEKRFLEIEKYLNRLPKLYLKNLKQSNYQSSINTEDVIYIILSATLYVDTYFINPNNDIGKKYVKSCSANKRRSIGDIYRLISGIRDEISFKEVYEGVNNLIMQKRLYTHCCPDINKKVYGVTFQMSEYFSYDNITVNDVDYKDEFGLLLYKSILDLYKKKKCNYAYTGGDKCIPINFDEKTREELIIEKSNIIKNKGKLIKSNKASKQHISNQPISYSESSIAEYNVFFNRENERLNLINKRKSVIPSDFLAIMNNR